MMRQNPDSHRREYPTSRTENRTQGLEDLRFEQPRTTEFWKQTLDMLVEEAQGDEEVAYLTQQLQEIVLPIDYKSDSEPLAQDYLEGTYIHTISFNSTDAGSRWLDMLEYLSFRTKDPKVNWLMRRLADIQPPVRDMQPVIDSDNTIGTEKSFQELIDSHIPHTDDQEDSSALEIPTDPEAPRVIDLIMENIQKDVDIDHERFPAAKPLYEDKPTRPPKKKLSLRDILPENKTIPLTQKQSVEQVQPSMETKETSTKAAVDRADTEKAPYASFPEHLNRELHDFCADIETRASQNEPLARHIKDQLRMITIAIKEGLSNGMRDDMRVQIYILGMNLLVNFPCKEDSNPANISIITGIVETLNKDLAKIDFQFSKVQNKHFITLQVKDLQ